MPLGRANHYHRVSCIEDALYVFLSKQTRIETKDKEKQQIQWPGLAGKAPKILLCTAWLIFQAMSTLFCFTILKRSFAICFKLVIE